MRTLLLDQGLWDLCLDAGRNIAVAEAPYAVAQDVASACRLFLGELYYDTARGIPYFGQILGKRPPDELVRAQLVRAALSVPTVVAAVVGALHIQDRQVTGAIRATDQNGVTINANF